MKEEWPAGFPSSKCIGSRLFPHLVSCASINLEIMDFVKIWNERNNSSDVGYSLLAVFVGDVGCQGPQCLLALNL